jgi:hypothetical protein
MSSQKATNSRRGHGRQAASSSNITSTKPLNLPQVILPAWKHIRQVLDSSVKKLMSMTEMLNGMITTISRLPNNRTTRSAAAQLLELDDAIDDELCVRLKEAEIAE